MDINTRISNYYQEYKADMDAARIAERKGNAEGARRLYLRAAEALCEMASLESGETRRQRVLHAEEVKRMPARRLPRTHLPGQIPPRRPRRRIPPAEGRIIPGRAKEFPKPPLTTWSAWRM